MLIKGYIFVIFLISNLCFATNLPLEKNIATSTPYWPQQSWENYTKPPLDSCSPISINVLARHGSRYPTSKWIKMINPFLFILSEYSDLILPQNKWVLNWTAPYADLAGLLTERGQKEHYGMAKRIKSAFPEVFTQPYSPNYYSFRETQVNRAGISASSFGFGLFENDGTLGHSNLMPLFIQSESECADSTLRFFDNCQTYLNNVKNNISANIEEIKFSESSEMYDAQVNISRIIGIYPQKILAVEEIQLIFHLCSADLFNNITNMWCSFLDPYSLEVLNYYEDLETYWTKSYGYPINYQMSVDLLRTITDSFEAASLASSNGDDLVNSFMFAHAETLIPFQALLGLFKDSEPLSGDSINYNRKFRTSLISPFASNFVFTLYKCQEGDQNLFLIKALLNEKEIEIPNCYFNDSNFCELTTFQQIFDEPLNHWDFASICQSSCSCDWR